MTVKICADCVYKDGMSCTKQRIEPKIDLVTGRVIERGNYYRCETQRSFTFNSCGRDGKWFKAKKGVSNGQRTPSIIERLLRMFR